MVGLRSLCESIFTCNKRECKIIFYHILSQTPNATRNDAEFHRSKFSRKTKMTNISQQQPINILKALIFICHKGSLCCLLIGQNLISVKITTSYSSFSKLKLVLLKCNVSQTQNPIPPMLINTGVFFLKQGFFLPFYFRNC